MRKAKEGSKNSLMTNGVTHIQLNPSFAVQDNPVVERTEKFLDLLEEYQNKLLDPRATLKEAHRLVEKFEREKDALLPLLNSLPQGDQRKEILNNALVTSVVEAIRFNRGDYV